MHYVKQHQHLFAKILASRMPEWIPINDITVLLRACIVYLKSAGLIIIRPSMLWVWAPLWLACLCPWARCLISIRLYLGPVACGECYNVSADGACAWPATNHPSCSEVIVLISWRGNNNGQQRFDLMERCYINRIYIIKLLLLLQIVNIFEGHSICFETWCVAFIVY